MQTWRQSKLILIVTQFSLIYLPDSYRGGDMTSSKTSTVMVTGLWRSPYMQINWVSTSKPSTVSIVYSRWSPSRNVSWVVVVWWGREWSTGYHLGPSPCPFVTVAQHTRRRGDPARAKRGPSTSSPVNVVDNGVIRGEDGRSCVCSTRV